MMDRLTGLRSLSRDCRNRQLFRSGRSPRHFGADGEQACRATRKPDWRASAQSLESSSQPDRGGRALLRPVSAGARPARRRRRGDPTRRRDAARSSEALRSGLVRQPLFAKALADYRDAYPEVIVDLSLENRRVDLVTRRSRPGAARQPRSRADAVRAAPVRRAVSRRGLARLSGAYGVAAGATRLAGLDLIVPSYLSAEKLAHMRAATARTAMRSDNSTLTYHAVLAGVGVAFLPDWIVGDDIAAGRLKVLGSIRRRPTFLCTPSTSAVATSRRSCAASSTSSPGDSAARRNRRARRRITPRGARRGLLGLRRCRSQ